MTHVVFLKLNAVQEHRATTISPDVVPNESLDKSDRVWLDALGRLRRGLWERIIEAWRFTQYWLR